MLLVAIAWLYVVLMVAVVQATGGQGSVLRAVFTFVLYGLLPLAILAYLFFGPARRRARRAAEARSDVSEQTAVFGLDADRGDHAPGDAVSPVRKEP